MAINFKQNSTSSFYTFHKCQQKNGYLFSLILNFVHGASKRNTTRQGKKSREKKSTAQLQTNKNKTTTTSTTEHKKKKEKKRKKRQRKRENKKKP